MFGGILILVATSIVFSLVGVLVVWNSMELFGKFHGLRPSTMPEDLVAMAAAFKDVECTIEPTAAASAKS